MFKYSHVLQCTLGFKSYQLAKLGKPPDCLLLLQVHIELLITIKFMCILAIGSISLIYIYTIVAYVVG